MPDARGERDGNVREKKTPYMLTTHGDEHIDEKSDDYD